MHRPYDRWSQFKTFLESNLGIQDNTIKKETVQHGDTYPYKSHQLKNVSFILIQEVGFEQQLAVTIMGARKHRASSKTVSQLNYASANYPNYRTQQTAILQSRTAAYLHKEEQGSTVRECKGKQRKGNTKQTPFNLANANSRAEYGRLTKETVTPNFQGYSQPTKDKSLPCCLTDYSNIVTTQTWRAKEVYWVLLPIMTLAHKREHFKAPLKHQTPESDEAHKINSVNPARSPENNCSYTKNRELLAKSKVPTFVPQKLQLKI